MIKFVCNATDAKIISKVVGDEYTLRRGAAVSEFIESLAGKAQNHNSEVGSDGCEPITAL